MDYPATLDVQFTEPIARWRPLLQWVLAIPHLIVMYVLNLVSGIVGFVSWLVILFTGRLPEGLAGVQCMCQRYGIRSAAYVAGLHDEYPPFEFGTTATDPGGNAATVNFAPQLEGRNRLTCALRLIWTIPAAIVAAIITIIAAVCWLIGAIAVLITGSWPGGLRDWVMKGLRAQLRLNAYAYLLTDQYPPLSFD